MLKLRKGLFFRLDQPMCMCSPKDKSQVSMETVVSAAVTQLQYFFVFLLYSTITILLLVLRHIASCSFSHS